MSIKNIIKLVEFYDSLNNDFESFIKFMEQITGYKLKPYQKLYIKAIWKPCKKHYIYQSKNIKEEQTIEFKYGSKLIIIPDTCNIK